MPQRHPFFPRGFKHTWLATTALAAFAAIFFAGCDLSSLTGNQCTPTSCDYVVNTLVAAGTGSNYTLLADSNNTLYQLSGTTWSKVSNENVSRRSPMHASPAFGTDHTIFIGNSTSTDGGKTWQPLCVITMAISPDYASDHLVFAKDADTSSGGKSGACPSGNGSFFTSNNGGQSWNTVQGPSGAGDPDKFVISPTFKSDKTIFATFTTSSNTSLYRSTDGGQSWSHVLDNLQNAVAVSSSFATDHTVIAVAPDNMRISTDGGDNWSNVKTPLSADKINTVVISPTYAQDKVIAIVSDQVDTGSSEAHGMYTSTDNGANWTQATGNVTQLLQNSPPLLFSPNYASDKTIFTSSLGQAKGPASSTDLGKTWTPITNGLTLVPVQ